MKNYVSEPQMVNIMIQASGSFEVLSRVKRSKKEKKVILTGRIEFLHNEDVKILSTDTDLAESKFSLNADQINTILKNSGFHLGECFKLLTDVQLEGLGELEVHYWA